MGLARDIRSAVKDAVPEYRVALDKAATEIGQKEARDLGEVALRRGTTRGDLAENLIDMTAVERRRLREGVRYYIDETLANVRRAVTDGNMDAREGMQALRELSSRASRDKLRMIVGDEAADTLVERISQAERAFELRGSVATNSRTFGRRAWGRQSVP